MSSITRSKVRSSFAVAAAFGAVLSMALPAAAEPTYPGVIQTMFGGQCAPQCTLCHTTELGGQQNLKPSPLTQEGYVMKMLPGNRGEGDFFANLIVVGGERLPTTDLALKGLLTQLKTANCSATATGPCDSDGDGVPDTVELGMDRDPDIANDQPGDLCVGPKYGCGASIGSLPRESSATRHAAAVMSLIGLGLVLLRRRTRK